MGNFRVVAKVAAAILLHTTCLADLVRTDFLEGIGDFEASRRVRWASTYSKPGYNFAAYSIYVDPINPSNPSLRMGYSDPTYNNSVGDGWTRVTGSETDPFNNAIFRITGGGINGSNCQYIALTGLTGGTGEAGIEARVEVNGDKPYMLHPGDTVTFKIDHIRMSDYSGLPQGTSVKYYMQIAGAAKAKELLPSSSAYSTSATALIPAGTQYIILRIYMVTSGNLGTKTPAIYVDGAHLYVKRAGQLDYERREVPVFKDRNVKTHNVFFHHEWTDPYAAVRDHDSLTESEDQAPYICMLRKLNPGIQVYLYQTAVTCEDARDSEGKDKIFCSSALTFLEATTKHPEWLYPDGQGGYIKWPNTPWYHVRITDKSYQDFWAAKMVEKIKLGYDGIWVDNLTTMRAAHDGIDRSAAEVQQFIHGTYPKLKAAGLKIIQNACDLHISGRLNWAGVDGRIYFDPFWVPTQTHPASAGFRANSPATVADVFFQEYAFFIPRSDSNYYDPEHWLDCLKDMDQIKQWNTALAPDGTPKLKENEKRYLHMWVLGREFEGDPAYGLDGWINFGLCSYLLGQNEWTAIGFRIDSPPPDFHAVPYPDVDYSVTSRLGEPIGDHEPINNDPYFRLRRYGPSAGGATGGVVVVNANPNSSRTFTLDFDAIDQLGNLIASGQEVTIGPHTGRIFFKQRGPVYVRIRVPSQDVVPGDIVTVTVDYASSNTESALGVVLRAKVPDEMTYVSGSAEISGGSYDPTTNTVSWTIGDVPAGQSGRRTFKARVK